MIERIDADGVTAMRTSSLTNRESLELPDIPEPGYTQSLQVPGKAPALRCVSHGAGAAPQLSLVDIARLVGEELPAVEPFTTESFAVKQLHRRQCVQRAGDPFVAIFIVQAGVLMSSVYEADGTEQVLAFPMRGDVVGLDGIGQSRVVTEVIALEASRVVVVPFAHLSDLSREHGGLQRMVHRLFGRELGRERAMLRVLGHFSAEARVASFLVDLFERRVGTGSAPDELMLPMRRQDMARYLGLQLETVSRAMSSLGQTGVLAVDGRRVCIRNRSDLRRIADCSTRQGRRAT